MVFYSIVFWFTGSLVHCFYGFLAFSSIPFFYGYLFLLFPVSLVVLYVGSMASSFLVLWFKGVQVLFCGLWLRFFSRFPVSMVLWFFGSLFHWFLGSLVLFFSSALVYDFLSSFLVIMARWLNNYLVSLFCGSLILCSGSSVVWFSRSQFVYSPVLMFSGSMVV